MSDKNEKLSPPYATYPSFINFINKLRETNVPNRIDPSTFGNASGSVVYSVIKSLKALNLISDDGTPSENFIHFVNANDEDRPRLLRAIIKDGYPSLFREDFDLTNITAGQFNDHIRDEFEVGGSTIDKIASFFLAAAKASEIPVSKFLEQRTPIASSPNSRKSSRQRKKMEPSNTESEVKTVRPHAISEKALEYRLVDLMSDAANEPNVMSAIIEVITFLKTKDSAKSLVKEDTNDARGE